MAQAVLTRAERGSQREVLRSFFDHSGICMAKLDGSTRLVEANVDFALEFGCAPAELSGTCFPDLVHEDARSTVSGHLGHLLNDQRHQFTEPEITFQRPDSAIFQGELTAFAVRDASGGVNGLMAVIRPKNGSGNGRPLAGRKLELTELGVRILEGVAAGVSTVELASVLYLSRGGVEYHVDVLMRKLKVTNRPALIAKAYFLGVLCHGWPPRVHPDYRKLSGMIAPIVIRG